MTLLQAVAIRWAPDAPPMLATVSAAARDVERWRIEIRDNDLRLLYNEVLDTAPRLLVAADRSGRAVLLISGRGLCAMRLVAR
jgi:hypothetical protein